MAAPRRVCEERKNKIYCFAHEGSSHCAYCGGLMPEEKPREYLMNVKYARRCVNEEEHFGNNDHIRVHDADACDRLNAYSAKITTTVAEFENMIDSYRRWHAAGPGAAMRWKFYNPDGEFEVRRS